MFKENSEKLVSKTVLLELGFLMDVIRGETMISLNKEVKKWASDAPLSQFF